MAQLSNEGRDKLRAALNHDSANMSQQLPPHYVEACVLWFLALSPVDRLLVTGCRTSFARGFEQQAELAAEALPAAPKWPQ
jgi:hypothetical protein